MTWDDATDARLRALWAAGHSTAEIGRMMGLSKNAVVGRAHRTKLPPRPNPVTAGGGARSHGVRPPTARGAAIVAQARQSTELLRAEAFRRHAQQGGGVSLPGPVARHIPAAAGIPATVGQSVNVAGCDMDVASLHLPPAVAPPRPGGFLANGGARGCRWPMWNNVERATQVFCDAPVRRKRGGEPCVYCAGHAAVAFVSGRHPLDGAVSQAGFAW